MLFPLRWMYQGATGIRNWMFDHRLRRAQSVPAKVISVGNLTVGGTGKTPVTLAVIDLIRERGHSCGVVSRGYKRLKKGIHPVVTDGPTATDDFGDEPVLIKSNFPDLPVFVGEKRAAAARKLLNETTVEFIVCDDAFQHRSLKRDLNLLLMDATESMKNYRVMPVGRAREALMPALKRVDYFVVTKTNLATPEQVKDLVYWIKGHSEKPVLLAAYGFDGFRALSGGSETSLKDAAYLLTGVARPETVRALVEGRAKILHHKVMDDHHHYTNEEIEAVLDEAARLGARWIVTTAKDAVKLSRFHQLAKRLWVIDMRVRFEGDLKAFYEDIDRLARTRD